MNKVYPKYLDMQLILLQGQILAREAKLRRFQRASSVNPIFILEAGNISSRLIDVASVCCVGTVPGVHLLLAYNQILQIAYWWHMTTRFIIWF